MPIFIIDSLTWKMSIFHPKTRLTAALSHKFISDSSSGDRLPGENFIRKQIVIMYRPKLTFIETMVACTAFGCSNKANKGIGICFFQLSKGCPVEEDMNPLLSS